MKGYPKEIRSLKELEKEKKRLQKQLEELKEQDFFSMPKFGGGKRKKTDDDEDGGGFDIMSLITMLPISNPIIRTALPLLKSQLTSFIQKKTAPAAATVETVSNSVQTLNPGTQTTGQKVKHAAIAVAKDVVIGYLKWKAIELAFKGVRHLVNKQREKKEAAIS